MIDLSNWTIVTGFFQLPEEERGNGYSLDKYKKESNFTLSLDHQMVIFCDDSLYDHIVQERSKFNEKTKIVKFELEESPYFKHIHTIQSNRKEKYPNGYPDPRNTPWYFILTMTKFTLLDMAIKDNPFRSTHFAWIDFKYSQRDANSKLIDQCLSVNRDLFSCCLIDYFPAVYALNYLEVFYQNGGPCTVAAGFFTAEKSIMVKIIDLMEIEFLDVVDKKYGHSEQPLMYILLLKYPELFEFYVGDYHCLLLNYVKPVDKITTLHCLIPNLIADGGKHSSEIHKRILTLLKMDGYSSNESSKCRLPGYID